MCAVAENLLLHSLSRPHGFEPLRVEGHLPSSLRGTLYRAGPGLFERFGKTWSHPFEADGAVTAVRFGANAAFGASRLVESAGYREEEARGRYLYNSAASWLDRVRAAFHGVAKTTGNTSTFVWQRRLFALMEGGLAQEMEPNTLETLRAEDFGVVRSAFSAHPHRVAALGTTFNFGVRYEKEMLVDLYALPDVGSARRLGTVKAPWMSMVHDFIATSRYVVLFIGPVQLVLWRALLGLADFSKLFRFRPELGSRMIVIPLDDVEHPQTFELEPFWVWHFANAFDVDGGIHVDLCRYDEFTLSDIGVDEGGPLPSLARLHLDLTTGVSSWVSRSEDAVEFPQVHPRVQGARHAKIFAQTRSKSGDAISCIDQSGRSTSWSPPAEHTLGEPVLVPRSAVEDDVWVLDLVLDRAAETSYLAVLDGQRLAAGPVATLHFDHAVPLTFHGVFAEAERC